MSDLGFFSARQIAPSQSLKQLLANGDWSFFKLKGSLIANVTLSWPSEVNPYGLLNFSRNCWKFFWRAKDQSDTIVGLGSVMKLRSQDKESLDLLKGLKLFGGLAFPSKKVDAKWEGFEEDFFVLPQVEWALSGKQCVLNLRLKIEGEDLPKDLYDQAAEVYRDFALATLAMASPIPQSILSQGDTPDKQGWNKMVSDAVSDISTGRYSKVVLSRYKELQCSQSIDLGGLLESLDQIEEDSYLFAFVEPSGKAFVGRSPERLLSWDKEQVLVDAIAGTRKRDKSSSLDIETGEDLQNSHKDLDEHRCVTEFVHKTLSEHCEQVESLEKEQLFRLKHVQHMRSTFKGRLCEGSQGMALLHSLHPTPAVGGTPADLAEESIESSEPFQRGLFTGAVGMTDGDSGDFAIGIRTALVSANKLMLFAGAGIVELSDPEAEWLETEMKMKNFLDLFGVAMEQDESELKH